jgi:REP element-mobilizing transposase RayT
MVRGIERRPLFVDDEDRRDLLERLDRILPEHGVRCFAWALMGNHFHLALQTGPMPLYRAMQRVGTGYAGRFNRRNDRVGHLVQNRFRSRRVGSDADLVGLVRYIHLNPMKGGLADSLDALSRFEWCGHGALVGALPAHRFHSVNAARRLWGDGCDWEAQLLAWMREGIVAPAEATLDDPKNERERRWRKFLRLHARFCRERGVDPAELRAGARVPAVSGVRNALARAAVHELGLARARVARLLGVSPQAVGRAAGRREPPPGPGSLKFR